MTEAIVIAVALAIVATCQLTNTVIYIEQLVERKKDRAANTAWAEQNRAIQMEQIANQRKALETAERMAAGIEEYNDGTPA
jgi:hypothetical protein